MPSPKLVPLLLSDAERGALEALVRKRTASQSLALRARIVLACAEERGRRAADGGRRPDRGVAGVGPQVAGPVHGEPDGRAWRTRRGPGRRGRSPTSRSRSWSPGS